MQEEANRYSTTSLASAVSSDGEETAGEATPRPWRARDLLFDALSSGCAALFWQYTYDTMAKNLGPEYYDERPDIDEPSRYFGNGYYWATNFVLGIAGGVGSILPRALFDTLQSTEASAYAFLVAAFPFSFSQTAYDAMWDATTHFYGHEDADAEYPTDSIKHALFSLVLFITIMAPTRYGMHYAIDSLADLHDCFSAQREQTNDRKRHNFADSLMATFGAAGFMIAAKRIANEKGLKALPIAFSCAAISRLLGECARHKNKIYRAAINQCFAGEYENSLDHPSQQIENNEPQPRTENLEDTDLEYDLIPKTTSSSAAPQTYMGSLWSWCANPFGGKSARETTTAERELNNLEAQTNYCKCCQ